jgi:phospholipid-binding lipoprotein MlaA
MPAPGEAAQPRLAPTVAAGGALPAPSLRHAPGDPLENFNRRMFKVHQSLDRHILRPAAMGYRDAVPKPVRSGLRHFFSNLGEPIVFANFVLQVKPKSAIRTVVRFLINSTIGLGGTIDVAKGKAFELPHKPNGLGDTLGFYGVKPGPYLFLPLLGPSDLRDFVGGQADGLLLPLAVGAPFDRLEYQIPKAVLTGLDLRAEVDADLHALLDSALDPYATLRSVYLQDRAGEIAELKGKSANTELPGDSEEPEVPGAATSPSPPAAPELQDPLADPAVSSPKPGEAAPEPVKADPVPSAKGPAAPAQR